MPYYAPLISPTAKIDKHYFWANFEIGAFKPKSKIKHDDVRASADLRPFKLRDARQAVRNKVSTEIAKYVLACATRHKFRERFLKI